MIRHIAFAAMLAGTLVMSACSAEASIGAASTPQPIPTQAPAPPQIIVVQQPVAAPAPAKHDDDFLILLFAVMLFGGACLSLGMVFVAYRQLTHPKRPSPSAPAAGNYLVELTPAQYQEWLQLQDFKARQIAAAQSQWMVRRGR